MSKELPYFRFFVNEWLNDDISFTDYSVKGVFVDVCSMYWFRDCSITKAMLEQRIQGAKDELKQLYDMGIIKLHDGGMVEIKFLDEQFDKLSEKRQKRVEAGRKGGLARASNAKATLKQSSSYKDKDKDKEKNNNAGEENFISLLESVETHEQAFEIWNKYRKKKGKHASLFEKEVLIKKEWKDLSPKQVAEAIMYTVKNGWITLQYPDDNDPKSGKAEEIPMYLKNRLG